MALTKITLEQLNTMSKEDLESLSGVKCIQTVFENGPNGRKVEMSEMKAFEKNEREAFVKEIRPVMVAAAKV